MIGNGKGTRVRDGSPDDPTPEEAQRLIESGGERVATFRYEDGMDLGAAIVKRIAALDGIDPAETDGTLHDVVCADAIERLLSGRPATGAPETRFRLTFALFGYGVEVLGDGRISVYASPV